MNTRLSKALWGLGALLSVGVALYAWHYLTPAPMIPPGIAQNVFAKPWLIVHAGLAGVAMALGPFQFLPRLRARRPRLHRWSGRAYVFACLVGGAAGLALATGSTAGPSPAGASASWPSPGWRPPARRSGWRWPAAIRSTGAGWCAPSP